MTLLEFKNNIKDSYSCKSTCPFYKFNLCELHAKEFGILGCACSILNDTDDLDIKANEQLETVYKNYYNSNESKVVLGSKELQDWLYANLDEVIDMS